MCRVRFCFLPFVPRAFPAAGCRGLPCRPGRWCGCRTRSGHPAVRCLGRWRSPPCIRPARAFHPGALDGVRAPPVRLPHEHLVFCTHCVVTRMARKNTPVRRPPARLVAAGRMSGDGPPASVSWAHLAASMSSGSVGPTHIHMLATRRHFYVPRRIVPSANRPFVPHDSAWSHGPRGAGGRPWHRRPMCADAGRPRVPRHRRAGGPAAAPQQPPSTSAAAAGAGAAGATSPPAAAAQGAAAAAPAAARVPRRGDGAVPRGWPGGHPLG